MPIRDYWRAIKGEGSEEYMEWQAENDKLKLLANVVDVIFFCHIAKFCDSFYKYEFIIIVTASIKNTKNSLL